MRVAAGPTLRLKDHDVVLASQEVSADQPGYTRPHHSNSH
jgi:hypothetical protein